MNLNSILKILKSCSLKQMDGSKEYNTKQNKSIRGRQLSYNCTHLWNLSNKKMHKVKTLERKKARDRLNYGKQTDGYQSIGGWVDGWNTQREVRVHLHWWALSNL